MQNAKKRGMAKPAEHLVLPCLFWLLFLTKKKSDKSLRLYSHINYILSKKGRFCIFKKKSIFAVQFLY